MKKIILFSLVLCLLVLGCEKETTKEKAEAKVKMLEGSGNVKSVEILDSYKEEGYWKVVTHIIQEGGIVKNWTWWVDVKHGNVEIIEREDRTKIYMTKE